MQAVHHSTKKATEKDKDRARQRRRRQNMQRVHQPETHAVDRAISEAVAYLVESKWDLVESKWDDDVHDRSETSVSLIEVMKTACDILVVDRDYDMTEVARALGAR